MALIFALGLLAAPPPVAAQAGACTPKTAKAADPGRVAADPARFRGQCVRLRGVWRDVGFYPSMAEAGQPDALSIATFDQRRIGLYLSAGDLARAPSAGIAAQIVGRVGVCGLDRAQAAEPSADYCGFKSGAFLSEVTAPSDPRR